MRERRVGWVCLGVAGCLLAGCATTGVYNGLKKPAYFGVAVNHAEDADRAISNVRLSPDNTVKYSIDSALVNKDISARGWINGSILKVGILNGGAVPLQMNYFSDRYYAKTSESRVFELDKFDISFYPSGVLNPGYQKDVVLMLPQKRQDEETVLIFAEINYGKTVIALKPVEVEAPRAQDLVSENN